MKKSLFIVHSLCSGGAEKVLIDILKEFDYSKNEVTLILIKKEGRYINRLPKVVKMLSIHNQTIFTRLTNKIFRNIGLYEFVTTLKLKTLNINNFDTIISFSHGDSIKYHTKVLKKAKRNITWVHCDMWDRNKYEKVDKNLEKEYYQKMDLIVFVSNDAKIKFNLLYDNALTIPTTVIYNLIPVDKIIEMADSKVVSKLEKFTICTVGRFYPEKSYDRLIRVAALLKQNKFDFEIWILGEGILMKKSQKLAIELNIDKEVIFMGFDENPYPFIKAADIFISTSKTEALPLVICEALCLGKPIISTKTTGPIELLSGDFGILTDHDDKSIYDGIVKLIQNPELRNYYHKRALEKSKIFDSNYTMESIYNALK